MKILAIGDFHGQFPRKISTLIRKENIDVVISTGDYFPFSFRKLWFKHCYGKNTDLWQVIGKQKYKTLLQKDLQRGEQAIKKLNAVKVPVFTVYGNLDYTNKGSDNQDDGTNTAWKWRDQNFFQKIISKYKNITPFSYSHTRFGDFIFVGTYGSTLPGNPRSQTYKKNKLKMENIFNKFKTELKEGRVIFVGHNVPFNTKVDKVGKNAHSAVANKHLGSKMIKTLIMKYQPLLYIGGHIHESFGKDKLKETHIVNLGAVHDGKAAVIELTANKIKKIKFIR